MKRITVFLLTMCFVLPSCGGGDDEKSTSAKDQPRVKIKHLQPSMPAEVQGLKVQNEDIESALGKVHRSYVEGTALYSLRSADNLVQATLQINLFRNQPRYTTDEFRRTIINQIGTSTPIQTRMGSTNVWRTTGSNQARAIWFEGRRMYLLSIRNDYDFPRTLIRTLVERAGE